MSLQHLPTSRKLHDLVIITILSGFLLFACTFSETNMSFASAAAVVLFEDIHFKGIKSSVRLGESTSCVNLIGKLNDFYSSVDTMGVCVLLCEHLNCNGKCERVQGKLEDLSGVGLNDLVSSVALCERKENGISNVLHKLPRIRSKRRKRHADIRDMTTYSNNNKNNNNFPQRMRRRKRPLIRISDQEYFLNRQNLTTSSPNVRTRNLPQL